MRWQQKLAPRIYIAVRPDLRGFHRTIQRELKAMAPSMVRIGQEWGRSLAQGINSQVNNIKIGVDMGRALSRVTQLNQMLDRLEGRRVDVEIRVDVAGAVTEVRLLESILNRLDRRDFNVTIDVQIATALARIAATNSALSSIDNRRSIDVDVNTGGATASVHRLRTALIELGLLASPAIAGIGAGIIGLIGPLTAAAVGFGGFAAVAIPAISRVREALQQQKQATQQSGAAAGQAQARAFALAGAQQQLASAVRSAADAHRQALDQVRRAEQDLAQAQVAAASAQRDLNRARLDARRSMEDLKNQVVSAGLAVQEQELAVEQARVSWQQMAATAQAAATRVAAAQGALAAAQAKQAQVLADPAATDQTRAQAQAQVTAAQSAVKSAQDTQKAADQQARAAEINYQQSVQRLKEQRLQLQRLQQDEKSASKAGVEGSDQVRSARERLAAANQKVTDSERALQKARADVGRADQQAADQVASARRALAQASMQAANANGALGKSMVQLTALEQQLADAWQGFTRVFQGWARSLQPNVIPVLIKGINLLKTILPSLTPIVKSSANAIGGLLDRANAAAKSPFWKQFSQFLAASAGPAITGLGTLVGSLLKSFAGLAQSFAPIGFAFLQVLNTVAARFAAFTTGLAENPAFQRFTAQFIALGPLMADTFSSLGSLVGSLFAALAPAMGPILGFINTLASSLASVLRQTAPAIQSVFSALGDGLSQLIVALAPVVVQLVQALAPLLVQLIQGLAPILAALTPILSQIITALQPVIGALLAGLQPALQAVVPLVGLLIGVAATLLKALTPLIAPLGQLIAGLLKALLPVLAPLVAQMQQLAGQALGQLVDAVIAALPSLMQLGIAVIGLLPALMQLAPLLLQWAIAFAPLIAPLAQLTAVLATNLAPVLRVLIPLVAVVFGGFVRYLQMVVTIARWAVNTVVAVLSWWQSALRVLGGVAMWLWTNAIGPAFRAIGAAAMWLWNNAIKPAFNAIATIAKWLYSVIAVVVVGPIIIAFKLLQAAAKFLWSAVISPIFRAIGSLIRWVWTSVIKPALNALVSFFRVVLAPVFRWIYNSVIKPVWNAIGTAIKWVWNNAIKPTFNALKSAVGTVSGAFKVAVDAIKKVWDKLKGVAKAPVAFVVNTVFNKGIVGVWNAVAKLVPGVDKLNEIKGFATGGIYPGYTPGRDVGLAAVSGGEAIMRPEFTKAVGEDFINSSNAAARNGGVSGVARYLAGVGDPGGVPGFAGHYFLGGVVDKFKSAAKGFFAGGLRKAAQTVFGPLLALSDRTVGNTGFGQLVGGIPHALVSKIMGFFGGVEKKMNAGGGSTGVVRAARSQIGRPYSWGGGGKGGPSYGIGRGAHTYGFDCSGLTEYAWWKGAHKSIGGVTNPQWANSHPIAGPRPGALAFPSGPSVHVMLGSDKPGYVIQAPYTGSFVQEVKRTSGNWRWPNAAKFDEGGYLPPGISTVANATGRPEPVLTRAQMSALTGAATNGGDRKVSVMDHATVIVQDPVDVDTLQQRTAFLARSATFG